MSLVVRPVTAADAGELADLLNAIIFRGGTTAFEEPFTPGPLDQACLTGPGAFACAVAVERVGGQLAGFQALVREPHLPDDWGDIATFARVGGFQKGAGTALFAVTRASARLLRLVAINATIRADNRGGLAYYSKMGFVDYGLDPGVPLRDGTPVDRIRKCCTLDAASAVATGNASTKPAEG